MTDIFISYSHQDERWKDELKQQLQVLQLHAGFAVWDDRQIAVGDNWLPVIEQAIAQARIAVLLVSSDFLTSNFIVRQEIPKFLQRREQQGLCIVPVVVRPCAWKTVPWLASLQGATKDNKPLSAYAWGSYELEQAFSEITEKVHALLLEAKQAQERQQLEAERLEQERQQREAEVKRLAQEQAAREAEQRRQAEQARQQAEAQRLERQRQQAEAEARQRRLNAEQAIHEAQKQRLAQEAEQKRLAAEQAKQETPKVQTLLSTQKPDSTGGSNKWLLASIVIVPLVGATWWFNHTSESTQVSAAVSVDKPLPTNQETPKPAAAKPATQTSPMDQPLPFEPEMVKIPAGSFKMGCGSGDKGCNADENPAHTVSIPSLWVGKYEVTFDEWDACVANGGCGYKPSDSWGRGRQPVINVNWDDTQDYVRWLSRKTGKKYRLLSESEWEYVARTGTITPFATGNCIDTNQANYDGNSAWDEGGCPKTGVYRAKALVVGSLDANPWGLYDLPGNVWEWVQDCYHDNYQDAPNDGKAWDKNCKTTNDEKTVTRVMRGGSWNNFPEFLRSALRYRFDPIFRNYNVGFRIARTD